jgi:hypothetical protein
MNNTTQQKTRKHQGFFCIFEISTKRVICKTPTASIASAITLLPNIGVVHIAEGFDINFNDPSITYTIKAFEQASLKFEFIECRDYDSEWVAFRNNIMSKQWKLAVLELNVINSTSDRTLFYRDDLLIAALNDVLSDGNDDDLTSYAEFFEMDVVSARNELTMLIDNIRSKTLRSFMVWKKYSRLIVECDDEIESTRLNKEATQLLKGGRWNWQ